ncbi:MAG TPA: DUF6130 family protein [Longimicrobiaceae bacterium]|jgi:hypothetical protein
MTMLTRTLALAAAAAALATGAAAQTAGASAPTAKAYRGASPYVAIENEPPPRLIVDPPLAEGLPLGVYWAQYRVENLRIAQVFGPGARQVSPRVGHLHVIVDDLPWWWADASDNNTIDIANFPPGTHKVTIQLVDPDHNVFPGQEVTHTFTIPARAGAAGQAHGHHARPAPPR